MKEDKSQISSHDPKKRNKEDEYKGSQFVRLDKKFGANMKAIVNNIVKRTIEKSDKMGRKMSFIKASEENTIKENMRLYFRGQDEHKLKLKLFFNRWSQILAEKKDADVEMLQDLGRTIKEKEINYNQVEKMERDQDGTMNIHSEHFTFDINKLKVISYTSDNALIEDFETQLIQPGEDLLSVIPFCPTVVAHKRRKKRAN